MTPNPIRRLSALTAFFSFALLAPTGLVMLVLPRGGGFGGGGGFGRGFGRGVGQTAEFLGLARPEWGEIHEIAGIVFLIAALIHLSCNWKRMKRHLGLAGQHAATARDFL